jgi:hypothetical protein
MYAQYWQSDHDAKWYWRIIGHDNRPLIRSTSFVSKEAALAALAEAIGPRNIPICEL